MSFPASTSFKALPLGVVRPRGWLENQLRIQANGLTGRLAEFWPDIAQSAWIGGDAEGWERGPYWLDGAVPLAYLLDDAVLKAQVTRWMDYIIDHQQDDGWLGPRQDPHAGSGEREMDPWPLAVLFKAMAQYYEASGDERVPPAMARAIHRIDSLLDEKPLSSWAAMRWPELAISIHWLFERTGDRDLLKIAWKVQLQGFDWRSHFGDFKYTGKNSSWTLDNHVVNHAMALKEPAVRFRGTGSSSELESARRAIALLDEHHGQATGVFTGDESLAGKMPSQGTELCAVVEYLFSLEKLMEAFALPEFGDRLERIAFNALPATFSPDMWAHQYDQQANQVVCCVTENPIYTNNGPDSNIFGLAPNFGCCTANMHQGWPKLVSHLWMTAGKGVACVAYAPCEVSTELSGERVQITVDTEYPFQDEVRLRVEVTDAAAFPILLRIPGWCSKPELIIDGESTPVQAGTFHRVERTWSGTTEITLRLPSPIALQHRYNDAVTIVRGPLIFSLRIGEEWRQIGGDLPHADWEVHPTTPWNYALELPSGDLEGVFQARWRPASEPRFSLENTPIEIQALGRRIPGWQIERGAAATPPPSPVLEEQLSPGDSEAVTLIPYGCARLRVTELPWFTRSRRTAAPAQPGRTSS